MFKLPASVSRAAVLLVTVSTTSLSAWLFYERAIVGEAVRYARGADGSFRVVTRMEELEEHLATAERAAAGAPGDTTRAAIVRARRAAVEREAARLAESSAERVEAPTRANLRLD
jgi:hypothetical protein